MRQGTAGFIPERLTEARDARSITQVSLAQIIGKNSSTSISRWERGEQSPEPETMEAIAKALNLPMAYFMRPMIDHGSGPHFYRSMMAATKAAREKARARLRWAQEISQILQQHVELPSCNVPQSTGARDHAKLEDREIEQIATECRRYWKLGDGPISDVHLLLENQGIVVIHDEVGSSHMDGLSAWSTADHRAYIYVATDKPAAVRTRFSAVHELAHLVLHRNIDQSKLFKAEEFKEIERQANLFASAFLLPAETFSAELSAPTLNGFLSLKERWKVSIAAMIIRCQSLGMIDESYTTRLWKHYSSRGWRKQEPFDDRLAVEKPRLLARSIKTLTGEGGWSLQEVVDQIPLPAGDIERLVALPEGELRGNAAQILAMPKLRPAAPIAANGGKIIEFPKRS